MSVSMVQRNSNNPIITINDIKPSADGLEVIGVFNPGACRLGDEIVLLMRVAEACVPEKGWLKVPIVTLQDGNAHIEIQGWKKDEQQVADDGDPRKFLVDGKMVLTSLSHLRLARSRDGKHFTVSDEPFLFPEREDETFGVEDARITQIQDTFYITYTAVSADGYGVALASTKDFVTVRRHGMILPPANKDSCIFPEKIDNRFIALHRPMATPFSKPSIWYAESPDLIHWSNHSCVLRPRNTRWEDEKIGVGPQPIKTDKGWLVLYHGCGLDSVYSLHLCLLDLADPRGVLKRNKQPLLIPKDDWEKNGFFANVVFSNGWVVHNDRVKIYYGAADESICLAVTTVNDMLSFLDNSA